VFQQLEELAVGASRDDLTLANPDRRFLPIPMSRFSKMRRLGMNTFTISHIPEMPERLEELTIYLVPRDTTRNSLIGHVARLRRQVKIWTSQPSELRLIRLRASSCPERNTGNWQLVRCMLPSLFEPLHVEVRIDVRYA